MVRSVLLALLVSGVAAAQDVPRAYQVPAGAPVLVTHPSWVFTEEGKARVDAAFLAKDKRIAELEARDISRQAETAKIASTPALTFKSGAILFGAGAVLATVVTILLTR